MTALPPYVGVEERQTDVHSFLRMASVEVRLDHALDMVVDAAQVDPTNPAIIGVWQTLALTASPYRLPYSVTPAFTIVSQAAPLDAFSFRVRMTGVDQFQNHVLETSPILAYTGGQTSLRGWMSRVFSAITKVEILFLPGTYTDVVNIDVGVAGEISKALSAGVIEYVGTANQGWGIHRLMKLGDHEQIVSVSGRNITTGKPVAFLNGAMGVGVSNAGWQGDPHKISMLAPANIGEFNPGLVPLVFTPGTDDVEFSLIVRSHLHK